ncbi:hypothetical protein ACWF94_10540 [Streptomyces sp. NPDC055078]
MTVTIFGFVHRMTCDPGPVTRVWVGPELTGAEVLTISSAPDEAHPTMAGKRAMTTMFAHALTSGRRVEVVRPDTESSVNSVTLSPGDPGAEPLQVNALEVTQAVQDLAHSVPLIAGKRTVVRAYPNYHGFDPFTVSGQLTVRSTAVPAPVTINSSNTVVLDPADAGDITKARGDAARSLNFLLPANVTAAGQLAVRLTGLRDAASGRLLRFEDQSRPTVTFQPGAPLRVRVIRVTYPWGSPPVTRAPTNLDVDLLISWLGRAYPVSRVAATQVTVAATATAPFGCGDVNAQIAAIRALDVNAGTDRRTHYYGMVADDRGTGSGTGFFMRGCSSGIPTGTPDPAVVASGPTGPGTYEWDFDGSYGDWYGGHELGHTFGRLHPGACGESQDDINNYPFPGGRLSTSDAGFGGFDVGDPANRLPFAAMPGAQWHDVMTYCVREWLSVYTYDAIRRRLLAEDTLPATAGASAGAGGAAPAPSGGRPDSPYPRRTTRQTAADGPVPAEPTSVSVVAQVNLTRGVGTIAYVNPVPELAATGGPAEGAPAVALRMRTADGTTAGEYRTPVKLNSELGPGDDRVGIVDTVVTAGPGTATVELLIDGTVADTFHAAGTPPAVRAVRAGSRAAGRLELTADLAEPPAAGHTFTVQVSTDGGRGWQTVGVGLKDPTVTLDRGDFTPGQEVRVRVSATNGFTTSTLTSDVLRM